MPRVFLSIQLVHGLKAKMKNKLMPMWDKIMLRKRYIIECINELLKNKANLVHSRHRSIHNFIMNLCSALTAYCFFDNKPEALPVYVEKSKQLELFAYWPYPELAYYLCHSREKVYVCFHCSDARLPAIMGMLSLWLFVTIYMGSFAEVSAYLCTKSQIRHHPKSHRPLQ